MASCFTDTLASVDRRWIAGYALRLVLAGVVLGGLLAAASVRLVAGLLFGVDVLDAYAELVSGTKPKGPRYLRSQREVPVLQHLSNVSYL